MCVCVCVCVRVHAHVYVCMGVGVPAYGAVVHACAIERSRVEFPLITVAHVFLFFLILLALLSFPWVATDSQWMLEYVVWCVMKMKKMKIGVHWPEKATSVRRVCNVDQAKNSGGQFITLANC